MNFAIRRSVHSAIVPGQAQPLLPQFGIQNSLVIEVNDLIHPSWISIQVVAIMTSNNHDPEIAGAGWTVSKSSLRPTMQHLLQFCAKQAENTTVDKVFTFSFAEEHSSPDIHIHESKLRAAGGPLAAMVERNFHERSSMTVSLSPEDDPFAFSVIRNYLYRKEIPLQDFTAGEVFDSICSAHRWQLMDLFHALCSFAIKHCIFDHELTVRHALKVAGIPECPQSFKDYFWKGVPNFYFDFSWGSSLFDNKGGYNLMSPCSTIWDLAIEHEVTFKLMREISRSPSSRNRGNHLLELTVMYLEPRIPIDALLQQIINVQMAFVKNATDFFSLPAVAAHASPRAFRLLAISLSEGWHFKKTYAESDCSLTADLWTNEQSLLINRRQKGFCLRVTFLSQRTRIHVQAISKSKDPPYCLQVRVFIELDHCTCPGVRMVVSEMRDIVVDKDPFPGVYFPSLSKELNLHLASRCQLHLWCTWRIGTWDSILS